MQAVAGQPGVSGYVLGGLGTGESPEQRQQIVQAVLQRLPAGAPRMLSSVGTPEEILEAVAQVCCAGVWRSQLRRLVAGCVWVGYCSAALLTGSQAACIPLYSTPSPLHSTAFHPS